MKYVFYLLIMSIIFSIGLYMGMDRTSPVSSDKEGYGTADEIPGEIVLENTENMVNREDIIEELDSEPSEAALPDDRPFLSHVANGGEQIVQTVCDNLVSITHTVVDGLF
ncbi:hypothetical protein SAMN04487944_101540 [Gracilibacillus ureilyticus]|uniref:Uncharacterized protein n=1 Tax=Gracilibacillus ureilyticus TaxID=531814 RepID=A0A1H9M3M4_9BACI|nr:hypothetical protein [Gracilibacillus ureilyticus]SER18300.1 hypothetical protein SAMN04487944_101540 [Gracilibacillus ureilyticus]